MFSRKELLILKADLVCRVTRINAAIEKSIDAASIALDLKIVNQLETDIDWITEVLKLDFKFSREIKIRYEITEMIEMHLKIFDRFCDE